MKAGWFVLLCVLSVACGRVDFAPVTEEADEDDDNDPQPEDDRPVEPEADPFDPPEPEGCTTDAACPPDMFCEVGPNGVGVCTSVCGCADDADCAEGDVCVDCECLPALSDRCEAVCERAVGCALQVCNNPEVAFDQCVAQCRRTPSVGNLLEQLPCDAADRFFCDNFDGCNCPEGSTPPGGACEEDDQCLSPGLEPFCVQEITEEGEESGFVGGYCIAFDCTSDRDCPGGSRCVGVQQEGEQRTACFEACMPGGGASCREGYGCWILDRRFGICYPACETDEDCAGGVCDPDTGDCDLTRR